jgi:hypothetical protein
MSLDNTNIMWKWETYYLPMYSYSVRIMLSEDFDEISRELPTYLAMSGNNFLFCSKRDNCFL